MAKRLAQRIGRRKRLHPVCRGENRIPRLSEVLLAIAVGLRATGIGAFVDEEVNRYLSLAFKLAQVVYHLVIGYAVPDPRLEA